MQKTKKSFMLRVALPLVFVLAWLGLSGVGGPYFGKISEVSSNDQTTFLPASAESTKVNEQVKKFQGQSSIPAIIVFESNNKLQSSDFAKLATVPSKLRTISEIAGDISPAIPSADGKAAIIVAPVSASASDKLNEVFNQFHHKIDSANTGINYEIGGPASFSHDLIGAFGGIDVTLLLVALAVVFIILLIVYRSPFLPIIVLLTAIFALSGAILVVWHLANTGIVQINGQVQGILFILVIGAATDYSLLYLARLREELVANESILAATKQALKGAWEPIVAAGGTVIVSLLCLLLSDLGSNRALGPVGGIGIAFALFAALTFLPSALLLLGRVAFWPKRPVFDSKHTHTSYQNQHGFWGKIGALVQRHPRRLWIGTSLVLLLCCAGILQLKASGVPQSQLVLGHSEARNAQALIDRHFPGGSGAPVYIIAKQSNYKTLADKLKKIDGVTAVSIASKDSPSGTIPLSSNSAQSTMPAYIKTLSARFAGQLQPTVKDGEVLLEATLAYASDSDQTQKLIPILRSESRAVDSSTIVGGLAAIQYDTNQTSLRDRALIIPVVLVAITVILAMLLRALVAPLILLLTTIISFGATLGIAALVFNHLFKFAGADPAVILFGFVFLVALGIDYNIFLMTRVREETSNLGVNNGTVKALVVTGGVITSAGTVLAATFAALGVIPILFLAQIAFIVAFGVLLDTIIVRSLLVPSLTFEVGRVMWWPSKLARTQGKK
jgi:RND superfamily putative drug exporter